MKGTVEIRTKRLLLRRHRMEDAAALHRYFGADEKMYEYSGWNPYKTEKMAAASVQHFLESYQDPFFYGWAIELADVPLSESKAQTGAIDACDAPEGKLISATDACDDPEGKLIGTIGAYDYRPGTQDGKDDTYDFRPETQKGIIDPHDSLPGSTAVEDTIEVGMSIRRDFWGKGFAREALQAVLTYLTEEEGICCVTAWSAADNIGSRRAMEHAGMRQTFFEQGALKVGSHIYDRVTYEYRIPVDLTFKVKGGTFNYRVGAVIIHNGKLLLMKNAEEPYYYTVGGRVRFNETTEETVVREVREEIGVSLKIDRFLFFQEQFFDGKVTGTHIHELGVYYLMKDSPDLENLECHSVTARGVAEELCWIPLEETGKYYIVPESVAQRLRDLPDHAEHLIEIDER